MATVMSVFEQLRNCNLAQNVGVANIVAAIIPRM
jgi:hypothetical protein